MAFFCKRKISKLKRKRLVAKDANTMRKYFGTVIGSGDALPKIASRLNVNIETK